MDKIALYIQMIWPMKLKFEIYIPIWSDYVSNIKIHSENYTMHLQSTGILYLIVLRGYYTPNLKFAGFVCHLKIINTFSKTNAYILK